VHVNLPSTYLRQFVANPEKSSQLSPLPDHTPGQLVSLQQGQKWKEHPLFQPPMVTKNDDDYWIGDLVCTTEGTGLMVLCAFFTMGSQTMADGYFFDLEDHKFVFQNNKSRVSMDSISGHSSHQIVSKLSCFTTGGNPLTPLHEFDIFETPLSKSLIKTPVENSQGTIVGYHPVKIVPIFFFTDDTSANISRQYNKIDSWSMFFGGLPFSERMKTENICFISAVSGSEGLNAMDLVPILVDDLLALEKGVVMFSAEHAKDVLVIAPLLFITADNPRHSEVCSLMASSSSYPCRMCHYQKVTRRQTKNDEGDVISDTLIGEDRLLMKCEPRTKAHYLYASQGDEKTIMQGVLGQNLTKKNLCYKDTGANRLLELQSFDPMNDTPIEILHTILLGNARYLIKYMVKHLLDQDSLREVSKELKLNEAAPGYSRTFRHDLHYVGSFLGRDFKQLIQVLPLILEKVFHQTTDQSLMRFIKVMKSIGLLCSLVFVRAIESNAPKYIATVEQTVGVFLKDLRQFDIAIDNSSPYCHLIKSHQLVHLGDNLRRFGCALHYETERGEQLNKFIREHIFHTNRHNPTRDIAISFSRESLLRNILDGGFWKNSDGSMVKIGRKAKNWIQENSAPFYEKLLGGSRIPQDNNYIVQEIKQGMCGVFSFNVSSSLEKPYFVGMARKQDGQLLLDQYEVNEVCPRRQAIITKKTDKVIKLSDTKTEHIIDMFMIEEGDKKVVNLCKFSSFWFFSENVSQIQ
jgi:hypothetical protein